jgi:hypothetical protein
MTKENREYAYKNFVETGQTALAEAMLKRFPELEVKEAPKPKKTSKEE